MIPEGPNASPSSSGPADATGALHLLDRAACTLEAIGRRSPTVRHGIVAVLAIAVATLAYVSPVQEHNSDGAGGLLAAQALLDSGTLALDEYRGDPKLSYSLDGDYRIRRRHGRSFHYSFGVPVVSAPFVWLLNRAGLHMLHREEEDFAQNLLSALICGAVFATLYLALRSLVGWLPALTIAVVSALGSSFVSTLATALWNSGPAILFLGLAVVMLTRVSAEGGRGTLSLRSVLALLLVAGLAFVCRPSAAFVVPGLLAFVVAETRSLKLAAAIVAGLLLATTAVILTNLQTQWLLGYYDPLRLFLGDASLLTSLHGTLFSPSRGLFVFSPFLAVVAVASILAWPRLRRSGLYWLSVVWIVGQVVAVATRKVWWGGHCYGPRMLAELILPFSILTALAWRHSPAETPLRRPAVMLYLGLGIIAVAIHSGQGLFNDQVRTWNLVPEVDDHPESVFDWRYPQFLASRAGLERRSLELETARLPPQPLGVPLAFDAATAVFENWHDAERGWRWSKKRSTIRFRLPTVEASRLHLLYIDASAPAPQSVDVLVNDHNLATLHLGPGQSRRRVLALPGRALEGPGTNRIEFRAAHALRIGNDPRRLGFSFRSLRLAPLPTSFPGVGFADEIWFDRGWGDRENGFRWSALPVATVTYPLGPTPRSRLWELVVETSALGTQTVEVIVNDTPVATTVIENGQRRRLAFPLPIEALRAQSLNTIEFRIPDARRVGNDPRQLGIRFEHLLIDSHASSSTSTDRTD